MINERTRLVLAIVIGTTGSILALRAIWGSLWGDNGAPKAEVRVSVIDWDRVAEAIDTRTTGEQAVAAVDAARQLVLDQAAEIGSPALTAERREDLSKAFAERIQATVDGDYMRDLEAKIKRGLDLTLEEPSPERLRIWKQGVDYTRGVSFGMAAIEVRVLYERGRRVAPLAQDEGFDAATFKKSGKTRMPTPEDPEVSRTDLVEVRLPMKIRPREGDSNSVVLVGYQFGWNASRKQWIPFANVIYHGPDTAHFGLPF